MGRAPKGAAARSADPKVTQFVETASVGDLRTLKKLIKAGKIEIDDGKEFLFSARNIFRQVASSLHRKFFVW